MGAEAAYRVLDMSYLNMSYATRLDWWLSRIYILHPNNLVLDHNPWPGINKDLVRNADEEPKTIQNQKNQKHFNNQKT